MKKVFIALALCAGLCACNSQSDPKVMARHVPERADDFVFENNLIAGRIYGKALEGNPTSPGIDIWVKMPGKLVANEWYAAAMNDSGYYHHDHGGKDCYKVAVSLGGGASVPYIDGELWYPATNWRSCEMLEESADKAVFVLHYPEWEAAGVKVSLDKKITVTADTYFTKVEDCYNFSGAETISVAAGVFRHPGQDTIEDELVGEDRYAIWEHASDQSVEPEDGMLGVAVYVPGAESVSVIPDGSHGICTKSVKSGETFTYYFGSCWSKADVKTSADWFDIVNKLK